MVKKLLLVLAVASITAMVSSAGVIRFVTTFAPEAPGATGSGSGMLIFDTTAQTLAIDVSWSGLSGTTTVAHIHCCLAVPETGTVGVAVTPVTFPGFPVGLSEGSYSFLVDLTDPASYTAGFINNFAGGDLSKASGVLLESLLAKKAYFNIHSTTFPPGEIRSFPAAVPEPSTFLLSTLGLAGIAAWRRKIAR